MGSPCSIAVGLEEKWVRISEGSEAEAKAEQRALAASKRRPREGTYERSPMRTHCRPAPLAAEADAEGKCEDVARIAKWQVRS